MTCDDDEDDVLILKVKYELVWCIGAVSYKNTKKEEYLLKIYGKNNTKL